MAKIPTVAALRKRLRSHRGAYPRVAALSGLSYFWLAQFSTGKQDAPKLSTIKALVTGLKALERERAKERRARRRA